MKKAISRKKRLQNISSSPADQNRLIKWYEKNKRPFPWRKKRAQTPYTIWVSEVMLQQTTTNTVIPYYERFIKKFKTLESLAQTPLEEVLPYWSGLGYYSRIKNLHKSACRIYAQKHFPQTYKKLLTLPGFGPYTARAVSSLAFDEKTGVLDANSIRVMTRYLGFKKAWWEKKNRSILQQTADQWTMKHPPSTMNQALMELGSLVCTAGNPLCLVCPLRQNCQAFKHNQTDKIPLLKKKKKKEIWFYQPVIFIKKNFTGLMQKHPLPVLKNYPLFPGKAVKRNTRPDRYHFVHSITHHNIYVLVSLASIWKESEVKDALWVKTKEIQKQNPSSLIQKILTIKKTLLKTPDYF